MDKIRNLKLAQVIEWLTYFLVFLLPWQTRLIYKSFQQNGGYLEYLSNSLYATEILLWLALVLFLVYLLKNKIRFQRTNLTWVLTGLFFWSLLTAFWSLDWNLTIYYWSKLIEGFLLYFLISRGPASKVKIMVSLVLAAVLQAVLAWQQFLTQNIFASKWLGMAAHSAKDLGVFVVEYGDERWLRAYGSLPHPNILGAFLVVALICILGLSLRADSRLKRMFVGLSWLIIIPALVFTFSRAAWVGMAICYLVFVIWLIVKKVKNVLTIQLLILGVVLASVMAMIFWQPVTARVLGEQRLELLSNQERLTLYDQSKVLIKDTWYRGVGLGNYTLAVINKINATWPTWAYQPVHNVYILVLAELGVVGLLLYLFVIYYLLVRRSPSIGEDGGGLFGGRGGVVSKLALVSLLIMGLFDHFLWSLYFGVMFWWLAAGLVDKEN